jgi:hypothetical protein
MTKKKHRKRPLKQTSKKVIGQGTEKLIIPSSGTLDAATPTEAEIISEVSTVPPDHGIKADILWLRQHLIFGASPDTGEVVCYASIDDPLGDGRDIIPKVDVLLQRYFPDMLEVCGACGRVQSRYKKHPCRCL